MNRAQKNQKIVDDALQALPEARLAKQAVISKVATWFVEGGHEEWAEECFKRLWLSYHETEGSTRLFKNVLCDVLSIRFPGWSSRGRVTRGNFVLVGMARRGYNGRMLNVRLDLPERRFCVSRTDDEFEELIEDWDKAIYFARNPGVTCDFRQPISDWILSNFDVVDWHNRDKSYWVELFNRVDEVTVVPPRGFRSHTVRRAKLKWSIFRQIITEKTGASQRHIPRGWYDDKNVPRNQADWLKRVRFIVRVVRDAPGAARGDDPVADYGERIGKMINGAMTRMAKDIDDPCMDNFRFAEMDKSGDLRRYWDQRARGCCGSCDQVVTIDGRKFQIGCNYGH